MFIRSAKNLVLFFINPQKKLILCVFYVTTAFWPLDIYAKDFLISCPAFYRSTENILIGVNIFNAKLKNDTEKYVLAPDKQTLNKDYYLYRQYWNPSKPTAAELNKYVECLYLNSPTSDVIYQIPNSAVCRFEFISKPRDKGIINKNSKAKFYCVSE